ncbi:MAG: NAD(+) synthase [Gemmatimonadales bacterium]|nr:MAG: NAD(+) synthase [Gemmatimonadales bacterium]
MPPEPSPTVPGTSPSVRLRIAQLHPRKGDVPANLARVAELLQEAAGEADLLVLPETVLSGYFVEGAAASLARSPEDIAEALGNPPQGAPDLVLGSWEPVAGGVANSAIHLTPESGDWVVTHVHRKSFLPTYGVFQEARFVEPGTEIRAFDTRFGRMGLLICEEMLHSLAPTILALDGAEFLVALAASPARDFTPSTSGLPGNLRRWDVAGNAISLEHGIPLVVAHLTGSEGGKLLGGGSVVHGPGGEVLARAPLFREALLDHELHRAGRPLETREGALLSDLRTRLPHLGRELERAARSPEANPRAAPPGAPAARSGPRPRPGDASPLELDIPLVTRALDAFLEDEVRTRRGFDSVVVAVSGGIDSAVSLLLARRVFPPEKVHALLLPYRTSSAESIEHGEAVCQAVGVTPRTIPITDPVDAYVELEEPGLSHLRRGNLAARFRALVLWDQSASLGALPLGTGNKSERLLGYFTWHADDAPPVNPLGDLFKTQVRHLARHLGVPSDILEKPASADLVEGVTDADELGVEYEEADPVLHWLLSGWRPEELEALGFSSTVVRTVRDRLEGTHWKRRLPTSAMLSSTSIGDFYLRPVDL